MPARTVRQLGLFIVDLATVVSLIGALGFGSVIGQYLSSGRQRRETRAKVLEAISATETSRWAPQQKEAISFSDAARNLRTAALLARIPRKPVDDYIVLAMTAHWLSLESWEANPVDPELDGGIDPALSKVVRQAASDLTYLTWAPWRGRVLMRTRMKKTAKKLVEIEKPHVHESIERAKTFSNSI